MIAAASRPPGRSAAATLRRHSARSLRAGEAAAGGASGRGPARPAGRARTRARRPRACRHAPGPAPARASTASSSGSRSTPITSCPRRARCSGDAAGAAAELQDRAAAALGQLLPERQVGGVGCRTRRRARSPPRRRSSPELLRQAAVGEQLAQFEQRGVGGEGEEAALGAGHGGVERGARSPAPPRSPPPASRRTSAAAPSPAPACRRRRRGGRRRRAARSRRPRSRRRRGRRRSGR